MRLIAGFLLAGFLLLATEVRFEHQQVLALKWQPLIPIVYALSAALCGSFCVLFWRGGGRKLLMYIFAGAIVVGSVGTWFHSKGKPVQQIIRVASVWLVKPGASLAPELSNAPPVLAPSAFIGLGLLGVLVCWKKGNK